MPPLLKLILIRLGLGLVTLWLVSVVVFAATQALPGDPAKAILGREAAQEELYQAMRRELGLDRPLYKQYTDWLSGVVQGDLGTSLAQGTPVSTLLIDRGRQSAVLAIMAALLTIPLSILIGSMTALWRDTKFDSAVSVVSLVFVALPEFVTGIILVLLFAVSVFHWFPAVSQVDATASLFSQLELFILPAMALTLYVLPYIVRMLRASMIEVLESEYVMMAHLKGLPNRLVIWRHALPNALGPTLQVMALCLAWLAGGIVTIEYLFGFPGIGLALVNAVGKRDMPVVQALCLVMATLYVGLNLLADIGAILLNPRLRTGLR